MSLLNPAMLMGLGLAAIPVLLHFLMRPRPRKLLFPALRLVAIRRKTNTRRMRLRHLWLLLLRVLVIGLIVFAVTRPTLPAANWSFTGTEWLTLAGILATAGIVYGLLMRHWRRQRMPNHAFTYRRTLLRGATGVGVLLLFLLLVVYPYQRRVRAEVNAPLSNVAENLPVAAVLLFDTSLSMEYLQENETRLERARRMAGGFVEELPSGSRVAVADSGTDREIVFQADRGGAEARIRGLEVTAASAPLGQRLRRAVEAQEEDRERTLQEQASVPEQDRQDRYFREVYVFTDLARSAWRRNLSARLREELARLDWLRVYLIDVGVEEPTNVSVRDLRLSRSSVALGGELVVETTVHSEGSEKPQAVELYLQNAEGKLVKQGVRNLDFADEPRQTARYLVRATVRPVTQGVVRVGRSDPLGADDERYFTVGVHEPPRVLVSSDRPNDAVAWSYAVAPPELVDRGTASFRTDFVPSDELATTELDDYDAVCLINVAKPAPGVWQRLATFVQNGGGLFVSLGVGGTVEESAETVLAYNGEVPASLLPGRLLAHVAGVPEAFLDLDNLTHPILRKFEDLGTGLLTSATVHRLWRVEPYDEGSLVARYTDRRRSPALLERSVGRGRVVLLTTGVDFDGWSDLPWARWAFVALADQTMHYLSGVGQQRMIFEAGETVTLPLDENRPLRKYLLRKPEFEQVTRNLANDATAIVVQEADQLGQYEVVSAEKDVEYATGFSVNPPAGESDFTRIASSELDRVLGEGRYSVGRSLDDVSREVVVGRIGQEVFPLVLAVVVVAFCLEHFVANRFYEADQAAVHQ